MANNIKYLTYDGLDYYTQKLLSIITNNEKTTSEALADLNNKLSII